MDSGDLPASGEPPADGKSCARDPFLTHIPAEIVRVMGGYSGARITRIMAYLRKRGSLREYNAIRLSDVDPADRGALVHSAWFAKAKFERDKAAVEADPAWAYLRRCVRGNRKNAATKGMAFTLTMDSLKALYARSKGCCEVTGVPFSVDKAGAIRAPFAPSIDRIDCKKGYTISNVRLVCQIANLAMNAWGDQVLHEFIDKAHGARCAPH